jgi:hypothetical protein
VDGGGDWLCVWEEAFNERKATHGLPEDIWAKYYFIQFVGLVCIGFCCYL